MPAPAPTRARPPLLFGITANGILHTDADAFDLDTKLAMVKAAGVFDYVERSPPPHELDAHVRACRRHGVPIRAGGFYYLLGRDEPLLEWHLRIAHELGATVHNVQLMTHRRDGTPVTDDEVAEAYLRAFDIGVRLGVTPCFEIHVNMWSEHYGRVERVAELVRQRGVPFAITLDASHVVFKIDNPREQAVQGLIDDVATGRVVLDPYDPRSVTARWIAGGLVTHAHARPAVPGNPVNVWARHPDGSPGRGIQYPFRRPPPGSWHSEWHEDLLLPWKHVMRELMRHHARDPASRLRHISTEIIPFPDYGGGARYSLFDDSVALAQWLRATWDAVWDEACMEHQSTDGHPR